jgi:putative transposase
MSRTALNGFPFENIEKNRMVDMIRSFISLYFTEILGFCIMGNYVPILVRMIPGSHFSDSEIKERFLRFYGKKGKENQFSDEHIPFYRNKWASLSEFLKERNKATPYEGLQPASSEKKTPSSGCPLERTV